MNDNEILSNLNCFRNKILWQGRQEKEVEPKEEQPVKKEPEKKKKKPAAATEEEDDGMPKEPKSKDPRTALPKGTFDLERFYSNNAW